MPDRFRVVEGSGFDVVDLGKRGRGARVLARTIGGRNAAARATAETLAKALNDMGADVDAHLAGEG